MPDIWAEGMEKIYRLIFDMTKTAYNERKADDKVFYNLYGARYNSATTATFLRKFHSGVDISKAPNAPVYAPFNGKWCWWYHP
jgi:murein DD-endopeptidase MepM/ murein hydrolase activator NlpD